jgi:RNA polymerase sigma factor (sigma-70 family)
LEADHDLPPEQPHDEYYFEPTLEQALAHLSPGQRTAIVLVHGLGWTYDETAFALDVSVSKVRNDLHRGMRTLRRRVGDA